MKLKHTIKLMLAGALRQTYFLIWPYDIFIILPGPESPTDLEAPQEDITTTSARVSWEAPPGNHDGYYLSYVPSDTGENLKHYPYRLMKGTTEVVLSVCGIGFFIYSVQITVRATIH